MKACIFFVFLLIQINYVFCQTTIRGTIITKKNEPVVGANIYIKDTFEGTTSDTVGKFKLTFNLMGPHTLIVSYLGYKTHKEPINPQGKDLNAVITIYEDQTQIDGVIINAGLFEAGDEKRSSILGKLDISTSGSSFGDIYGAIRSLPGTAIAEDDGGLLVRGGERYETNTYIDGLFVESPFTTKLPDIPVRGRFSPMLFRGTVFSTGGYSAEYGQALSSALILNSIAFPSKDETNVSLFTTGCLMTKVKRWKSTSLTSITQYGNMAPYYQIVPQNTKWVKEPESFNETLVFRQGVGKSGLLKAMGTCSFDQSGMFYYNTGNLKDDLIALKNANYFFIASFNSNIGSNWIIHSGISINRDIERMKINQDNLKNTNTGNELKLMLSRTLTSKIKLKFGGDIYQKEYKRDYCPFEADTIYSWNFSSINTALFAETDIDFNKFIAIKAGGRFENLSLSKESYLSPRLALAVKLSKISQVSFGYGWFTQQPQEDILVFDSYLKSEKAEHYILNYQIEKNSRIFRVEVYYKKYVKLIKYDSLYAIDPAAYSNTGNGYAQGIDLFYRDNKSIRNVNFWISYSFIDSRRNYKDFTQLLTPFFLSKHNLSVVYKHYIAKIDAYISTTYSFASGRPYIDPNISLTVQERTKAYNDLSLSCFYNTNLFKKFLSIYFQVTNIPGFNNIFGYRFSKTPNTEGVYEKTPILPVSLRFFIIGIYLSLEGTPEF